MNPLHNFLFNVYPYICLAVFFMGSLARFDRDQYTWKSDSSQLLRKGQLRWGSNLFHIGILFLFGGHTVGLLTPHFMYEPFITAEQKQLVAVQLVLGLITLPYSFGHKDAGVMLALADWAQRIVTLRPDAAGLVALDWPYKVHLVLGMTIFLLFPFSRLVHVWSGFGTLAYVVRPYQVVRSRKLGLTPNDPRQP